MFIVPAFPLSGKSNYGVEEFSAERRHGEAGSGDSLPILHRGYSDPIPRLEAVRSHFQTLQILSSDTFLTKSIILVGVHGNEDKQAGNLVSFDPADFEMFNIYQGNFQS